MSKLYSKLSALKGRSMDPELDKRRQALENKLQKHRVKDIETAETRQTSGMGGVAQAFKISSEFIAGILVGGVMGWAIDHFFSTSPWGLIVFLLLGFCAGILNVLRATGRIAEHEIKKPDE